MTDLVWPEDVFSVLQRSITAEYASLSRDGAPVTVPVTPYFDGERRTIDVSTGLTYPAKAERARRNPRVCLLFADSVGSGLENPPVVMVQGLATVRDSDLQANADRYVRLSTQKLPAATAGTPRWVLRRMAWYYSRIWVEVTPIHVKWWASRDLSGPAREWDAPAGTAAPLSDPAPSGKQPGAWIDPSASWRELARSSIPQMRMRDLTFVDSNGFPLCIPVASLDLREDGFVLRAGEGAPSLHEGPACLTMHTHPDVFVGQENRTFVGSLEQRSEGWVLVVARALGHWSISGGRVRRSAGFLAKGRKLGPRLKVEAKRRSQPVPAVRFPDEL